MEFRCKEIFYFPGLQRLKMLAVFGKIFDAEADWQGTKMLALHSKQLLHVVSVLANQQRTIGNIEGIYISEMWNETNAQRDGTIRRCVHFPENAMQKSAQLAADLAINQFPLRNQDAPPSSKPSIGLLPALARAFSSSAATSRTIQKAAWSHFTQLTISSNGLRDLGLISLAR